VIKDSVQYLKLHRHFCDALSPQPDKHPDEPDVLPPPDAFIIAPATFNTINKLATGISDTLALGLVNEGIVAVLMAAVLGVLLAAVPGTWRIIQLRRAARTGSSPLPTEGGKGGTRLAVYGHPGRCGASEGPSWTAHYAIAGWRRGPSRTPSFAG
jgi:hypothetical protein